MSYTPIQYLTLRLIGYPSKVSLCAGPCNVPYRTESKYPRSISPDESESCVVGEGTQARLVMYDQSSYLTIDISRMRNHGFKVEKQPKPLSIIGNCACLWMLDPATVLIYSDRSTERVYLWQPRKHCCQRSGKVYPFPKIDGYKANYSVYEVRARDDRFGQRCIYSIDDRHR